jgi:5-methylcytosine-specific restriction endonuclease McrA
MLRADNNAQIVRLPATLEGLFTGRYAVRSGKRLLAARWKKPDLEALKARQHEAPVVIDRSGPRSLWFFRDRFYWDDAELGAEDVAALVGQRERRETQKLQSAHSLMRAEAQGRPGRAAIGRELRRAVYERDGGSCVECSATFDLQYDHVLPVALGGATTLENLQLLCAQCNQRKSDSL